jgi:hypothetical protein
MRVHLKRRKTLRNAGLATMLAAAALTMSGCWATLVDYGSGDRDIVLKRSMTDAIIWNCTVEHGTGSDRAFCALNTVGSLCFAFPIKGISANDCYIMENEPWEEMDGAIRQVLGDRDCLVFFENFYEELDHWGAVQNGYRGCPGS